MNTPDDDARDDLDRDDSVKEPDDTPRDDHPSKRPHVRWLLDDE